MCRQWIAFILIILIGAGIGFINGFLSFRLQGQALILTLGVGFAVSGGTQILTSIGTAFGGNVFGVVPKWLSNIASINGVLFGFEISAGHSHLGYRLDHSDCRASNDDLGTQTFMPSAAAGHRPHGCRSLSVFTGSAPTRSAERFLPSPGHCCWAGVAAGSSGLEISTCS